MGDFDIDLI